MRIPKPPADDVRRLSIAEWSVTLVLLLFGTTTIAQAFVIPTGSMENNLLIGDHLLVDKLAYAPPDALSRHLLPYEEPKHGDIIVFRYPPDLTQTLVKRLIGAPGDHIRIAAGEVYRNGLKLKEPYVLHKHPQQLAEDNFPAQCCRQVKTAADALHQADMLAANVHDGELTVPPGMYFAMGDNRDESYDSRYWGLVPRENIVGKPLIIYWSYAASTEELTGQTAESELKHLVDMGQHFFSSTRWNRTFRLIKGYSERVSRRPGRATYRRNALLPDVSAVHHQMVSRNKTGFV